MAWSCTVVCASPTVVHGAILSIVALPAAASPSPIIIVRTFRVCCRSPSRENYLPLVDIGYSDGPVSKKRKRALREIGRVAKEGLHRVFQDERFNAEIRQQEKYQA